MNAPVTHTTRSRRVQNRITRTEFLKHLKWALDNKDSIQTNINSGASVAALATERDIAHSTMGEVLTGAGIQFDRAYKRSLKPKAEPAQTMDAQSAVLTVLHRLCRELNVPHSELIPFLS